MAYVGSEHVTYRFAREATPVLAVRPGDEVTFATLDASGNRIRTVADGLTLFLPPTQTNPVSGPVFVEGARPGDALVVEILAIRLGPQGYSRIKPGAGVIIKELDPCGFAPALPDAIRLATSDMATLLAQKLAISREEAFVLIGACGDARPGQCAELGMDATARVAVPRLV